MPNRQIKQTVISASDDGAKLMILHGKGKCNVRLPSAEYIDGPIDCTPARRALVLISVSTVPADGGASTDVAGGRPGNLSLPSQPETDDR